MPPHPLQEVTVDTLAGGRILVRNPAPGRGGGPDEWRLVEELRLGQVEGTGPEVFGDVHDVAVDEKGHIYVLDYGSKEVRVFDRDGRHLRNMARDGGGPGEFRYSGFSPEYRIVWQPPNRLWIADRYQQLSFDSLGNELSRVGAPFGPGMPIRGSAMRDGMRRGTIVTADGSGFIYQPGESHRRHDFGGPDGLAQPHVRRAHARFPGAPKSGSATGLRSARQPHLHEDEAESIRK